jgi:hypothetical protein
MEYFFKESLILSYDFSILSMVYHIYVVRIIKFR